MSKENYDSKIASIEAIPDNQTQEPNMPVANFVQEAEDTYEWAKDDKTALTEAGLDITLLEDIPARAGALRYAQSIWQKEYNTFEEAQKEWKEKSPEAFNLHDVLIHEFFHAYHDHSDLYSKVRNIAEGGGNADMLQDMSDLAVLGKANPEPLNKINLDMTLLDKAELISEELSEVLAKANGLRMSDNEMKIIRDKAFIYLKQAVDEVRRHGQYKFWRNPERRKGYSSRYNKIHRRSVKENTDTTV